MLRAVWAEIGPKFHFDHAPLFVSWNLVLSKSRNSIWRLNNSLLLNVVARIHQDLDTFWQVNHGTRDAILLWETFKAYVRGSFISQSAYGILEKENGS